MCVRVCVCVCVCVRTNGLVAAKPGVTPLNCFTAGKNPAIPGYQVVGIATP